MEMVSSVQRSIEQDLRLLGKKEGTIRQTGDGDGQMRLGYIGDEAEQISHASVTEKLRSDGYIIQFQTNPQTRQYSGNVQKLSRRLGSLNALRDNLENFQVASQRLESHIASAGAGSESYLSDPAELITLATELESFRTGTSDEVQKLRLDGVNIQDSTRRVTIDLADPEVAARSIQELQGISRSLGDFVTAELGNADVQLEQMVALKTPAREPDPVDEAMSSDPLMTFMREVHTEMLDAGQQMISAQANLDPVKVYELLRE